MSNNSRTKSNSNGFAIKKSNFKKEFWEFILNLIWLLIKLECGWLVPIGVWIRSIAISNKFIFLFNLYDIILADEIYFWSIQQKEWFLTTPLPNRKFLSLLILTDYPPSVGLANLFLGERLWLPVHQHLFILPFLHFLKNIWAPPLQLGFVRASSLNWSMMILIEQTSSSLAPVLMLRK